MAKEEIIGQVKCFWYYNCYVRNIAKNMPENPCEYRLRCIDGYFKVTFIRGKGVIVDA